MSIPSLNLGIECDGVYWHKNKLNNSIDKKREEENMACELDIAGCC